MSVLVGVGLSVTGSVCGAVGLNLQRLAQRLQAERPTEALVEVQDVPEGLTRDARLSIRWRRVRARLKNLRIGHQYQLLNLLGVLMAVSAGLFDLAAFNFAPSSLLAPFGATSLIVNLMLAPLLHGERLRDVDIVATLVVMGGIALSLAFGNATSPRWSLPQLLALARRPAFAAFASAYVAVLVALATHVLLGEHRGQAHTKRVGAGYPCLAGMLAGVSQVSAKFMTELFRVASLKSEAALLGGVIAVLAVSAVSQLVVLNRGIGKHSPLFVVPLFSASALLSSLSLGGTLFDEFSRFAPAQLAGFCAGVALVVFGVGLLATKNEDGSSSIVSRRALKRWTGGSVELARDGVEAFAELEAVKLATNAALTVADESVAWAVSGSGKLTNLASESSRLLREQSVRIGHDAGDALMRVRRTFEFERRTKKKKKKKKTKSLPKKKTKTKAANTQEVVAAGDDE